MSGKMLLTARLNQRMMMNQKLKQVITFLQSTTLELKQQIKEMVDTNPLIEVKDDPESSEGEEEFEEEYGWTSQAGSANKNTTYSNQRDDDYIQNIAAISTLRDHLIEQTYNCHFNTFDQDIAVKIIDAIDDDGYFGMSLEELQATILEEQHIEVELARINEVLKIIQTFEPVGIGARSTAECLQIQLDTKFQNDQAYGYAKKILDMNGLQASTINIKDLSKLTGLSSQELTKGLSLLHSLDFHPAKSFNNHFNQANDPELYVRKIANEWRVFLTDSILTRLDINEQYRLLIKKNTRDKSYKTVLNQLQEANLLVNGIKRRNETLLAVASYIVKIQSAFFDEGRSALQSFTMAEVAAALEFHESTISRITSGKYIATPHGIFELKYFFPSHVKTEEGPSKSSTSVKLMIEKIIESETQQKTFSDDEIMEILKKSGIHISRRTVAKYREALNIPSSYLRSGVNAVKEMIEGNKDEPLLTESN